MNGWSRIPSYAHLSWFKSSYSGDGDEACVEVAFTWRKSSYSGDEGGACVEVAAACIEVALAWTKSSHSSDEGGDCVEIAACLPDAVHVRDSKHKDGPKLEVPPAVWAEFLNFAVGS